MKRVIISFLIVVLLMSFSLSFAQLNEKEDDEFEKNEAADDSKEVEVGSGEFKTMHSEHIDGFFEISKNGGELYAKEYFFTKLTLDGEVAFCLEPEKASDNNVSGFTEIAYNKELKTELSKIVYFAWDNSEKTDKDIVVTQFMIWQHLGWDIYQMEGTVTLDEYHQRREEVLDKISALDIKPSFDKQSFSVLKGQTIVITDDNKQLEKMLFHQDESANEVVVNGNTIHKNGNQLEIKAEGESIEKGDFILRKVPSSFTGSSIVYFKDEAHQKVGIFKVLDPIKSYLMLDVKSINGKITITKYGENEDVTLAGAVFVIKDDNGEVLEELTTDENGYAESGDIHLGSYIVEEVAPPKGYVLDNKKYDVALQSEGNNELVYYHITVSNKPITSSVEITKLDISTKEPIANCEIGIYKEDGTLVEKQLTDKEGVAKFKELTFGTYYFLETKAPEGYILNTEKHFFEVKEDGEVIKSTLEDEKIKQSVEITKLDFSTKEPIANCEIGIYKEDGALVEKQLTDQEGVAKFKELTFGAYYFLETKAPEGYILNPEKHHFEVKEDGEVIKPTLEDKIVEADIKIQKVDSVSKVGLEGCTIEIVDAGTKETVFKGTTDSKGELHTRLKYGTYLYHEINAPKGYVLDNTSKSFSVDGSNDVIVLELSNNKKPELPKTGVNSSNYRFIALFAVLIFIKKLF